MMLKADQSRKPEVLGSSEFTQEVMREVLRQNAEILQVLLNPTIYMPPRESEKKGQEYLGMQVSRG